MEHFYMPILKTKEAEYIALSGLSDVEKKMVMPMFELFVPSYDNQNTTETEALEKLIKKSTEYLEKYWPDKSIFIDGTLVQEKHLGDGSSFLKLFFDELPTMIDGEVIPIVSFRANEGYLETIQELIENQHASSVCLRVFLEDFLEDDLDEKIHNILDDLDLSCGDVHLVVDIENPENMTDHESFATVLKGLIDMLPNIKEWASLTVAGGTFPPISEISKPGRIVVRGEWLLHKELLQCLDETDRTPNFGDYGIDQTGYNQDYNPRVMKSSASIRYTIDDGWIVTKGKALGDSASFQQFIAQSSKIKDSKYFMGADFSQGDKRLQEYANGKPKGKTGKLQTGNPKIWREIGFNHHFTKVINDLSATPGASLALV